VEEAAKAATPGVMDRDRDRIDRTDSGDMDGVAAILPVKQNTKQTAIQTAAKQVRKVLWTQKAPACLLTAPPLHYSFIQCQVLKRQHETNFDNYSLIRK